MFDPLTIYAISVTAYAIYEKTQNTKLRKAIEQLTLIITELNKRIKEKDEELRELRIFHIKQMIKIKKEIKSIQRKKNLYHYKMKRLEEEAKMSLWEKADKWTDEMAEKADQWIDKYL